MHAAPPLRKPSEGCERLDRTTRGLLAYPIKDTTGPRAWHSLKLVGNRLVTQYSKPSANASPSAWSNPPGGQLAAGMLYCSHPRGLPRQWQAGALAATLGTRLRSRAPGAEWIACPNPSLGISLVVF